MRFFLNGGLLPVVQVDTDSLARAWYAQDNSSVFKPVHAEMWPTRSQPCPRPTTTLSQQPPCACHPAGILMYHLSSIYVLLHKYSCLIGTWVYTKVVTLHGEVVFRYWPRLCICMRCTLVFIQTSRAAGRNEVRVVNKRWHFWSYVGLAVP